jgi:hypothetical protein
MANTIHEEFAKLQPVDWTRQRLQRQPIGRMIKGFATPCSYTPTPDPEYIFHETSRDIVVWLMSTSDPLYVFGPTGSGKTSAIKQLASRLNYPSLRSRGTAVWNSPTWWGTCPCETAAWNTSMVHWPWP